MIHAQQVDIQQLGREQQHDTGGNRERDLRTGFSIPFRLTLGGMLEFALKPMWGLNYVTHERFSLPQLDKHFDMGGSAMSIGRSRVRTAQEADFRGSRYGRTPRQAAARCGGRVRLNGGVRLPGAACAEFSWEGFDDGSPASGRGWAALGMMLGLAYGVQMTPHVWCAFRVREPTGIAPHRWTMNLFEALLWGVYGVGHAATPVVVYAVIGTVCSAAILGRVGLARMLTRPSRCAW
jgi:hypothetical protein